MAKSQGSNFTATRSPRLAAGLLLAAACLATPGVARSDDPPGSEPWPSVRATEALDPVLRSGEGYRVREEGRTDAFLTTWELETDYGLFVCPSRRLLEIRVREVAAMRALLKSGGDEAQFLSGLQTRVADVPTAMVKLVENPLGTVEGAAEGAKRTLGRVGDMFGKRKETKYEAGGVESALFAQEKRKVAAELRVDVYSTNTKLQTILDEVAKARRAGGFGVDLAKMAIPGFAGTAVSGLSTTSDMTSVLRDRTPAEIDRIAGEALGKAGVMPQLTRQFLANPWLSPRHRATISDAVGRLARVGNPGALVAAAVESRTEAQALLHEEQALFLASRLTVPDPVVRLDVTGGIVVAFTASGAMLVPVPVDVVALAENVDAVLDALLAMDGADAAPSRVIEATGRATPRAVERLKARGFVFVPDGRWTWSGATPAAPGGATGR